VRRITLKQELGVVPAVGMAVDAATRPGSRPAPRRSRLVSARRFALTSDAGRGESRAMRPLRRSIALAVLVFGLVAGASHAADLCIVVNPGDTTRYVGRGFAIPAKGKCKPWSGVYLPSFANVSVSTGTGCTSSDGATLRLHLVTARENVAFNDYIVLPLPSLTGGTLDEVVAQFGSTVTHIPGITASKCDPKANPIP
jgi:hypothetical protein